MSSPACGLFPPRPHMRGGEGEGICLPCRPLPLAGEEGDPCAAWGRCGEPGSEVNVSPASPHLPVACATGPFFSRGRAREKTSRPLPLAGEEGDPCAAWGR